VGKIAVLPPLVQGQIAAGEVIERPASVVKELVENALDAGARRIEVRLAAGGVASISVRDDGEGMHADDALLAFARHATSKLATTEDIPAVGTLGFRGEALPSIAAAGRVRLVTRRADATAGVAIEASGEGAHAAGVVGAAPGTTVEVHDLFGTTPARRKFLRAPATEAGHAVDVMTRLAVANPHVGFHLEHDGRELLDFPPVGDAAQRLAQVLGRERAARLLPLEARADGCTLTGFVGPPTDTVATARLVWTYIAIGSPAQSAARRWIRDRVLLRAVLDGYESLLLRGRYPVTMLTLHVPPGEVDLNVHPAKLEVRFRRPALVHQLIVPALRARLVRGLTAVPAPTSVAATIVADPLLDYRPDAPAPAPASAGWSQPGLWAPAARGFASLRFIGQIFDGYLLCEGDGKVVLIDQHAAHERVVFERLRAERQKGGIARDPLLVPETIELAPAESAALAENAPVLAAAGLEGEPFGERTFLLRTIPRLLRGKDAGTLLRALAAELAEDGASGAVERALDATLATIACHSVVRVGQRLDAPEVRALLDAMDGVEVAAHCPHGRPVAAELGRAQLEALFRR
jgi:DNA mismatch repair protein MutL